jgi:hypothetical protein
MVYQVKFDVVKVMLEHGVDPNAAVEIFDARRLGKGKAMDNLDIVHGASERSATCFGHIPS